MKQILTSIIFICSFSALSLVAISSIADDSETPKYSDEQLQKLKAAEEKYKDNPQVLKIIDNIKANSGITDTVVPEKDLGPEPVMAHGKVITEGSYQDADSALRYNDMETTIANYRIMADEGDTEVSVKLGYIYETEGNTEAAYAAYKQAAESGDQEARKMALERMKWLEENGQVNQSEEGSPGASTAKQSNEVQYRTVMPSVATETSTPIKSATYFQPMNPREVKISPERVGKLQHFKPEKFTRTPKS